MNKIYMCIDLKSFYASVECVLRNLDPLNTNLVVADSERTDKTVCLAITPSLKQYGLGGRARLFEVRKKVKEINYDRLKDNHYKKFISKSYFDDELKKCKNYELDFIIAKPRMKRYIKFSSDIYEIYLNYVSKDDIFVYSIDEVFIDATSYLKMYNLTPTKFMTKIINDVYNKTGITATGGIGSNLFLAKIAMDVVAKHVKPNEYGVRIAILNEESFKKYMWDHKPITDIWRIGKGTANKLEKYNIFTLGDIALKSIEDEDLLYKIFGVNAELLIDHAWGYEPCTISDLKNYKPLSKCLCSGQVLHHPYKANEAEIIIKEMCDSLAIDLVNKCLVTKQLVLDITYDVTSLDSNIISNKYFGDIIIDSYGRKVPKGSHGTVNLDYYSSSSNIIMKNVLNLYKTIVNPILLIRKVTIFATNLKHENNLRQELRICQMNLFDNESSKELIKDKECEDNDRKIQTVMLNIRNKYGKNSIIKGMNLDINATGKERNQEVGGHHE